MNYSVIILSIFLNISLSSGHDEKNQNNSFHFCSSQILSMANKYYIPNEFAGNCVIAEKRAKQASILILDGTSSHAVTLPSHVQCVQAICMQRFAAYLCTSLCGRVPADSGVTCCLNSTVLSAIYSKFHFKSCITHNHIWCRYIYM